jgi:hypothetical protein
MKLTFLNKTMLVVLAVSLGFLACEKKREIVAPWDETGSDGNFAQLRIVHASPNFRALTGQADSINIFVNGSKINGARLTYGGAFPAVSPTTYAAVPFGAVQIKVSVGGLVNLDSIGVATINANFTRGERYSFIITDSLLNASRDSARMLVRDSFPTPLNGRTWLRMVNALVDTATDKRVDVWSTRRNNNLFTNVQPGSVGAFTNQPFINFPDTLIVRRAGTATELARLQNITFANQRVYTIFLRGDVIVPSGAKARTLTWYTNR